jgi:RNA polymerase sigma-70 factor, ECF subfamily
MASLDGWDLEHYLAYLRSRARLLWLDRRVRVRFDESDLVQETLQRALASGEPCRGTSERERIAWLERIQDRVLIDKEREHHADKRDVNREQDLQDALAGSTAHWEGNIAASDLSPSEEAERQELFLRVMTAIQQLTQEQQDAVMAIRILQLSTEEAAKKLGKSKVGVVGLYHRGIKRLRQLLQDNEGG